MIILMIVEVFVEILDETLYRNKLEEKQKKKLHLDKVKRGEVS